MRCPDLLLRWLRRRRLYRDLERDVDEEIRFHIEMRAEANRAHGMPDADADADARRRFGNADRVRSDGAAVLLTARIVDAVRGGGDALGQDVRYAARRLTRAPGFSLATVAILSAGLTASTAIFTYIDNFDRMPPGVDGRGLYRLARVTAEHPFGALSYPDYRDLEAAESSVGDVAAVSSRFAASVRHETSTDVAFGQAATADLFRLLGMGAAAGRLLGPEDDRPGAAPTVVLSHAYWLARYSGDGTAVGRTVVVNGETYTIVGVTAPDFLGPVADVRPDIWLPFEQYKRVYWARSSLETDRGAATMTVYTRARSSIEAVEDALASLASSLDAIAPLERSERRFRLVRATWIDPVARRTELPTARLWLAAGVGLLFLACANVANLVLAASAERGEEMAMRRAIGARSGRLVRQLLTESVMLASSAGLIALALAGPVSNRIGGYFARPSVWGANVSRDVELDLSVLAFVIGISLLTGISVGILPALKGGTLDPSAVLRRVADRGRRGRAWLVSRDLLITAQVGLSLVLLMVAALVLRTLFAAASVDPGFDTYRTVASYVSTSSLDVDVDDRHRFYDELERRFDALPWVLAATVSDFAPLSPHAGLTIRRDGAADPMTVSQARVADGYFDALGIPTLEGRSFTPSDTVGGEPVAVLGEGLARRLFGAESAIGRVVWLPEFEERADLPVRIVGVTKDARLENLLGPPELVLYLPFPQHYSAPGNALLVATTEPPDLAARRVEEELRRVDPRMAIVNVLPYADVIDGYLYEQRMNAELFLAVAILGSFLAAVGIFAIISVTVGRRKKELGVRMALGASGARIGRLVVRRVAVAGLLGAALGLALTVPAGRVAAGVLYGVEPWDRLSLGVAATILVLACAAAAAIPARRAVRSDPTESLRM